MGDLHRSTEPWSGSRRRSASACIAGLHLAALTAFAVAQPIYDLIGKNAAFLVAHGARAPDVVAMVLILSVLVPVLLLAIEILAAVIARRAGRWLHRCLIALLLATIALQVLKRGGPLPGPLLVGLAVTLGLSGAALYVRRPWPRGFISWLSPAALVFPLYFMLVTPVASLLSEADSTASGEAVRIDSTTPVVILIFDEFAAFSIMDDSERIDSFRFPHLAALAEDSTWFRDATAVAEGSHYAIPAMLSGRYPVDGLLPTSADYPDTLLSLLGATYDLKVFESFTSLCPEKLCGPPRADFVGRAGAIFSDLYIVYLRLLLPADLTAGLPSTAGTWRDFGARGGGGDDETHGRASGKTSAGDHPEGTTAAFWPGTAGQFDHFLDALRTGRDSTLYMIHLMLPHVPWRYLPSGKQYGPEGMRVHPHGVDGDSEQWSEDRWSIAQAFQRYLLQVGYVDRLIGEVTGTLKQAGLYEPCLLAVVADHGVSFRPGDNRRNVTDSNFPDIANVPFLVKLPGQRQAVISDRNVQAIDLLPTIADVLGVAVPWSIDGRSAVDDTLADEPSKKIFRPLKEPFVFDAGRLSARRESLEWMLELVGPGSDADGLFAIGPRRQLLGRRAKHLIAAAADADMLVDLDGMPQSAWHYQPQGAVAPTHITGRVIGPAAGDASLEIAIAVNGFVRALTHTFDRQGQRASFSAMVAESSLNPGPNQIEFFAVVESAGHTKLRRLPAADEIFSLEKLADGTEALLLSGRTMPVRAGEVTGEVDLVQRFPGGWARFEGWAVDQSSGAAADRIVVFAEGRLADASPPQQARPDIARRFSRQQLLVSGFNIELAPSWFPDHHSYPAVRIFAVSKRGVASELMLPGRAR